MQMAENTTASAEGALPTNNSRPPIESGWDSTSTSKLGYVRAVNEDALLDAREETLWVVADGMGGHSYGDKASKKIIDELVSFRRSDDMQANVLELQTRLEQAHQHCRSFANGKLMGSTVAALFVHDPYCFFLWAGDSRIYRYRDQKIQQMTEDHSLVQQLVTLGEIQREEMESHPSSHIITRAVGVNVDLDLATAYSVVQPGDRYMVCSDGLYKDLTESEISERMASTTINEALDSLVELALNRGGTDNTTAIVVQVEA